MIKGKHFVGASADLLKMGCEMKFNPPSASHCGGVWERMIGSSRRVIEGILIEHGHQLDDESLMTIFSETANIVNSRPLNVQNLNDPNMEPLTANHLLTMKSKVITAPPTLSGTSSDLYALKRWKRVQYLANLFWSRWKREVLLLNQSRCKWNKVRRDFKVNDIVLVIDELVHRSHWKMARVKGVKTSDDGFVRSVNLILADRSGIDRPVQKLILLTES